MNDESLVERVLEILYGQCFCGIEHFQHTFPLDPTSLVRWRKQIKPEGMEKLLLEMTPTAQRKDLLRKSDVARVNADTMVQEKAEVTKRPFDHGADRTKGMILWNEAFRGGITEGHFPVVVRSAHE